MAANTLVAFRFQRSSTSSPFTRASGSRSVTNQSRFCNKLFQNLLPLKQLKYDYFGEIQIKYFFKRSENTK